MNKVILIGRLTQEPELSYTSQKTAYCRFSLAINRPKKQDGTQETDFINCNVWNKQAENLCQYQNKGNQIAVEGSIRTEKYQDKEGNDKISTYVLVNNIQFLGNKNETQNNEVKPEDFEKEESNERDPFADFGEEISTDDNFLE